MNSRYSVHLLSAAAQEPAAGHHPGMKTTTMPGCRAAEDQPRLRPNLGLHDWHFPSIPGPVRRRLRRSRQPRGGLYPPAGRGSTAACSSSPVRGNGSRHPPRTQFPRQLLVLLEMRQEDAADFQNRAGVLMDVDVIRVDDDFGVRVLQAGALVGDDAVPRVRDLAEPVLVGHDADDVVVLHPRRRGRMEHHRQQG